MPVASDATQAVPFGGITTAQAAQRDKTRDGFVNRLLFWVLTNFQPLWNLVQRTRPVERLVNKRLIDRAIDRAPTRPSPHSTRTEFTCWSSLTDRTYFSRHLPPSPVTKQPEPDDVAKLFRRPAGTFRPSTKSTVLFGHFAQWFTDSFLRSDRKNLLKNTSNHELDLCSLYGLNECQTNLLRELKGGRLKSQIYNGEEYPPFQCDDQGNIKPEFEKLPLLMPKQLPVERRKLLFAMGVERANVTTGYVMMNVLFLREHNRIARCLSEAYPCWDDERLFQTARNILIHQLLRIVVEDYINHIAPYHFKFRLKGGQRVKKPWYRTNWVAIEFNLLYRWHCLVPEKIYFDGIEVPAEEASYNNDLLLNAGIRNALLGATNHQAGEVGLFNTPEHLLHTETASLKLAREARLATYNEYREWCKIPKATRFNQISSNPAVCDGLSKLYRNVDCMELYVGLFAEDVRPNSVLAPLMGRMVGIDAFSQALTNPLLAERVYNKATFSEVGMKIIEETRTLNDIVKRTVKDAPSVSFTHSSFTRSPSPF